MTFLRGGRGTRGLPAQCLRLKKSRGEKEVPGEEEKKLGAGGGGGGEKKKKVRVTLTRKEGGFSEGKRKKWGLAASGNTPLTVRREGVRRCEGPAGRGVGGEKKTYGGKEKGGRNWKWTFLKISSDRRQVGHTGERGERVIAPIGLLKVLREKRRSTSQGR